MLPEIHNIVARWNREAGVESTGVKIKEVKDDNFRLEEVVVGVFSDNLGRLIGGQGRLINKYKEEIANFYREQYPKLTISVKIELTELNEIVGQQEIDVDKYYQGLIEHVLGSDYGV